MPTPELEPSLLVKALDYAWGGVLALCAIVYKVSDKKHEDRRKGEIALHEKLDGHAKEDRESFRSLEDKIDKNHGELMNYLLQRKDT